MHQRLLILIASMKINGVYASAAIAAPCSIMAFLPVLTEGTKFLAALAALISGVISIVMAWNRRKATKNKQ